VVRFAGDEAKEAACCCSVPDEGDTHEEQDTHDRTKYILVNICMYMYVKGTLLTGPILALMIPACPDSVVLW